MNAASSSARPLVPAWALAAAAIVGCVAFDFYVKRGLREAERASTRFASIHSTMGILYSQHGRLAEAAAEFNRALELDPTHAEASNNLGNILLQQGRWDEALASYRKALDLRPQYADAQNNIGLAMLQKGRLEEAIGHFLAALDYRPNYADAQNNLGYALLQKGRLKDAEQHFQKAVELNAGMGQAHHNLALCLYSQGRVAEALARYETAIKTDPRQLSSINNLAWILATTTEASLRDGARALELAQQANALTGGADATVLHTLAAALAENGRFPEAVATAEASLQRATAAENGALAEAVRDQLRAYRLGQPYREAAPAAAK